MPITVGYEPIDAIVASSYITGRGQYDQRQQQQALQYAQLAQQDAAQRRALEANMISQARAQAFNAREAGMDRAFRFGMRGMDFEADRIKRGEDFARDRDLAALREEGAWDRALMGFDADRLAANERARLAEEHDKRNAAMWADRDREDWIAAGLKGGELYYSKAQKASMANLRNAMNALETAEHLTPEDKALEMQELNGEFDRIRKNPFAAREDEKPVPTEEKIQTMTTWMVGPDGKRRQYQVQTRNGVEQVDVVAEEDTADPAQKFVDSYKGKMKSVQQDVDGVKVTKRVPYTAEDIAAEWEVQQKAQELIRNRGGAPPQQAAPPPAPQQQPPGQAKFGGGMQLPPQQQAQPPQRQAAPEQLAPGSLIEDGGQTFWVDPQSGQSLPVFPRNSAEATKEGNLVVDERGVVMLVQGPGQYVPVGEVAKQPQAAPEMPPEIAALPSGATFRAPDGSLRRKP